MDKLLALPHESALVGDIRPPAQHEKKKDLAAEHEKKGPKEKPPALGTAVLGAALRTVLHMMEDI